ncbi:hypothetical protein KR50_27740 [Jeotgalibacillus campisalis]|uniref:Uncharacterized protein n=1 Tax=Jeotgalibacillus campisalis TaxID=220754 RepID=A0A0C2RWI1_9BACL|nr:hypothetical protein KR50_27740 [Jeotgalibacillus campisalis]
MNQLRHSGLVFIVSARAKQGVDVSFSNKMVFYLKLSSNPNVLYMTEEI